MAEVKVQIAVHFQIDPAKQSIGLIDCLGLSTDGIHRGPHHSSTVSFSEAYRPEDMARSQGIGEAGWSHQDGKAAVFFESRSADPIRIWL